MKFKKAIIAIVIVLIAIIGGRFLLKNYFFPYKHGEIINKYSKEYNLDPLFVLSVIKAESGFDKGATSHKDAIGLMQITKSTGTWIAEQMNMKNFTTTDLYNENTNIKMGCWYLNNLTTEFKNRDLVVAAYNAGRGNVNKWLKDGKYSEDGKVIKYIPFKETKNYVDRVNLYYKVYELLYR